MAPDTVDVFVSHASHDAARVRPLVAALERAGLRVWHDEHEIEPHAGITDAVRDGIARSKLLLAWYSATYPTRRACQWELTAAFVAAQRLGEDPRGRVLVVNPERVDGRLRTDHVEPVELRDALCAVQPAADEEDWDAEAARIAEIAAAHTRPLGDAAPAPPPHLTERLVDAPGFVGRLTDLWRVHSALSQSDAVQITGAAAGGVAQLTGLGGIGKSLLAEEYALRFAAAYPGGIVWLRASEDDATTRPAADGDETGGVAAERQLAARTATRDAQFAAVATSLGVPVAERGSDEVRAALALALAERPACLWIVDDLPEQLDHEEVRAWLAPHPNARTLLTTRSRGYRLGERVELGCLPAGDGFALLTAQRTPTDPQEAEAAHAIVEDLGGHPLALAIAAHALAAEAGMRSFADYRAALGDLSDDELELARELAPQLPNGHEASIAATLSRSIERLDEPGRDLLRFMSMLAPAPLPRRALADAFALVDDLDEDASRRRAVGALAHADALSLIEPGEPETFAVHALVSRTMRIRSAGSERILLMRVHAPKVLLDAIRRHVDSAQSREGARWVDDRRLIDLVSHAQTLAGHVIDDAESGLAFTDALPRLLHVVARYHHGRSDYRAAATFWQFALTLFRLMDEEALEDAALETQERLVDALVQLDRIEEARQLAESLVQRRRELLRADDPQLLDALQQLAGTLDDEDAQRELFGQVAEQRAAMHGEHARETLTARNDHATTLIARDAAAASAELREIVACWSALGADEDPDALRARHNLAVTLHALGETTEARALFQEVLEARLRVLPRDDPDTLGTMLHLAQLIADDDPAAARELVERAVAGRRYSFGDGTAKTTRAEQLLARMTGDPPSDGVEPADLSGAARRADALRRSADGQHQAGDHAAALGLAEQAVAHAREAVREDPRHVSILAAALHTLVVCLIAVRRHDDAVAPGEEGVGLLRELAASEADVRLALALALNNLGIAYGGSADRMAEAVAASEEAVALSRELAAADRSELPGLAVSLTNLTNRLIDADRHAEARGPASEAVALSRELAAADPRRRRTLAYALGNLGVVARESGWIGEQEAVLAEAARVWRELAAEDASAVQDLMFALLALAEVYLELGRDDEAGAVHAELGGVLAEFRRGAPAPREPRPGRNDPCWCGSGEKFKRCHGR